MEPSITVRTFRFDHPQFWERISEQKFIAEVEFLHRIFTPYKNIKHILDVGCGTGTHLNLLSKKGYTCVGIDLNPKMISYAKKKYQHITFKVKDMRELTYKNTFDAIYTIDQTINFNTTNEELFATLKGFYKSLKKNGILVIDSYNPICFIQKKHFNSRVTDTKDYRKIGHQTILHQKIDEPLQTITAKRIIKNLKNKKIVKVDTNVYRLIFPQEMKFFLEQAGFTFLRFYRDYAKTSKQVNNNIFITVARK